MSDDGELGSSYLPYGLAASAARLVPVPFLDDFLREKAFHLMVSRALKEHGRTYGSGKVSPLYGDPHGCMHGCLTWAILFPIKLLLFPFRKFLVWVMALKYIAQDASEAVLLGRMLERSFEAGRLAMGAEAGPLEAEALLLRQALDNASQGTDMRVIRAALRRGLSHLHGARKAAFRALRRVRASERGASAGADEGSSGLAAVLATPELRAFMEEFDARFDENVQLLEARRGA